jgi:hypothetical protein
MTIASETQTADPAADAELDLLRAAIDHARHDASPSVPHDIVRQDMLREIERLQSQLGVAAKS